MNVTAILRCIAILLTAGALMAWSVTPAAAQDTGAIAGVVVDGETGDPLPGANVSLAGTTTGTATDLNGRYQIKGLDPGTYDVVFSFIGFQQTTVTSVEVQAGETTPVDIILNPQSEQLDEVIVTAEAARDSEAGLLKERQKAAAMSDAISAEAMSQAGASTAAAAMEKVTGATVTDGKYVNIRGLGGRYVNTQLNGADLPSADPDRNATPLDLFPAGLLDNIVTSKTFTPEKPGSFTGGSVNLSTRSFPENLEFSLSTSTTYHSEVEYGDILRVDGGLDALPDAVQGGVPPLTTAVTQGGETAARLDRATRAFTAQMTPVFDTAPIDQSYSLSFGNSFQLFGGTPLGVVASGSYSQSVSAEEGGTSAQYVLTGQADESDALDPDFVLRTESGSVEELFGGLLGLSIQPHPNHELSVNGLFNRSEQTGARTQAGPFPRDLGSGEIFVSRALENIERTLYSVQGRGQHLLFSDPNLRAEWTSSYTNTQQEEPDVRFFNSDFDPVGQDTIFNISPSIYPLPTRYFRDLSEYTWSNDLSFTLALGAHDLKVGGRYDRKRRTLDERRFVHAGSDVTFNEVNGDPEAYFGEYAGIINGDANNPSFGTYISEVSQATNNFTAERTVGAGFAMIDGPVSFIEAIDLRIIAGARLEYTDQTVENINTRGQIEEVDVLPSVNLVYAVTDNMNVRAAYGRTIARPSFREFAPFNFFDFINNETTNGNPDLQRTTVDNLDFRWEWFMRPGELLAASAFYKGFTNPIERTLEAQAVNREVTFKNQDDAVVFGAEFEARKRLDVIADALQYLQVGGNLTLSHSSVTIAEEELENIRAKLPNADDSRPLQGQSPVILNLDLSYENPEIGTTASIFYNYFGDRLNTLERAGTPNQFERSRHTMDVVASQRVFQGLTAKVSVKNLLNQAYRLSQTFNDQEFVNTEYKLGRTISVSLEYSL